MFLFCNHLFLFVWIQFLFLSYFQNYKSHHVGWLVTLITCLPALIARDPSDGDMPWQPEEIVPFELVDELNGTFYELIDISCNVLELAMVIHSDMNPDTEQEFKQLAAVYTLLFWRTTNYEKVRKIQIVFNRIFNMLLRFWWHISLSTACLPWTCSFSRTKASIPLSCSPC